MDNPPYSDSPPLRVWAYVAAILAAAAAVVGIVGLLVGNPLSLL